MTADTLGESIARFAESVASNFEIAIAAQPEDQLKRPVQNLLEAAGRHLGVEVRTRTEATVAEVGGRPDVGVTREKLLTGHVELKAPGKGARTTAFRGADRAQWQRFQALPNLIYTDGSEWALYRNGERVGPLVRLSPDVTAIGEVDADQATALADLLRDFLFWEPTAPSTPRALAELLAPLCRFLRDEVLDAVARTGSALHEVAEDWRRVLFPDAGDAQFADAYAQTVTYALLLARFEGTERVDTDTAAHDLERRHGLLARALRLLSAPEVRREIELGVDLLERVIGAVDQVRLARQGDDPWLYFYEDFLAAYDPKLRKDRGVYYTPSEVILAQCRLTAELLIDRFERPFAFAADDVISLDPAAGTGAYPRAALALSLDIVQREYGPGAVAGRASVLARNLHAFEILVGPYAVAHLRLTQGILDHGGELPGDGVHVYLTDTLESPTAEGPKQERMGFMYQLLSDEHRRARAVKAKTHVFVCLGNPPYDREQKKQGEIRARKGGWVRFGDKTPDSPPPILEDFLAPAQQAGYGIHLKNAYNDYVYFWRWALWKVFESTQGPGIVSFITASSYLRGPGFVGMRQHMRQVLDELWVLDLEGDSLGPRKTENVFDQVQTPVAIAIGVRYGDPQPRVPAKVRYARLTGSRGEKLARLSAIRSFDDLAWEDCFAGWMRPFLPEREGDYFAWPSLTDLMPWQISGLQVKRVWPIGTIPGILVARWEALIGTTGRERGSLLRETRDRQINKSYQWLGARLTPLALEKDKSPPALVPYSFRTLDRQWLLLDARLIDFARPGLWKIHNDRQLYLTSLLTTVLGTGPSASVAANPPDLHHYRGSFGGKDVIPLWRDAAASEPNVVAGLLDLLTGTFGRSVSPENFFAYAYSILASPAYAERFSEELTVPGPRLPITRDGALFDRAVELGRRLIWLHTYGERFVPSGERHGRIPKGQARALKAIPGQPERYPERFEWNEQTETLRVGDGEIGPVSRDVWEHSVSGLEVVKSWLGYRMRQPSGKKSSPLDEILPERWTAELTEELLRLLWILEQTIELQPELAALLEDVTAGATFTANELPKPSKAEKEAPTGDDEQEEPERDLPFET